MALEHEDIMELKQVFDERYVLQRTCNEQQESMNRRFASDDKRIDLMAKDINTFKKLMWIVATSGIGTLVGTFLGLILK